MLRKNIFSTNLRVLIAHCRAKLINNAAPWKLHASPKNATFFFFFSQDRRLFPRQWQVASKQVVAISGMVPYGLLDRQILVRKK